MAETNSTASVMKTPRRQTVPLTSHQAVLMVVRVMLPRILPGEIFMMPAPFKIRLKPKTTMNNSSKDSSSGTKGSMVVGV